MSATSWRWSATTLEAATWSLSIIHTFLSFIMLNLSKLPKTHRLASSTHRLPVSRVSRRLVRLYSQPPGGQETAPEAKERTGDASKHAPSLSRNEPRARGGIPTTGSPVVDAAATALIGLGAGESLVRPIEGDYCSAKGFVSRAMCWVLLQRSIGPCNVDGNVGMVDRITALRLNHYIHLNGHRRVCWTVISFRWLQHKPPCRLS